MFDLLWTSRDQELVIEYGLWLIVRDRAMGLKVRRKWKLLRALLTPDQLFSDPTQVLSFHTKDLFARIVEVDSSAADLFLENVVLSKRDTVGTRWSTGGADECSGLGIACRSHQAVHQPAGAAARRSGDKAAPS